MPRVAGGEGVTWVGGQRGGRLLKPHEFPFCNWEGASSGFTETELICFTYIVV